MDGEEKPPAPVWTDNWTYPNEILDKEGNSVPVRDGNDTPLPLSRFIMATKRLEHLTVYHDSPSVRARI